MRTLAFDGRMGASGDMLLGALLAAGADRSVLEPVEATLGVRYDVGSTTRCGISATTVDVLLEDETKGPDSHDRDGHHSGDHDGDDHQSHHQSHDGDDHDENHRGGDLGHDHTRAEGSGPHRSFPEVVGIVESLDVPPAVESDAVAIFELLGEAEASVHGTPLEDTHFHEVGADDAIADVVGVALLLDDLDPDAVVTTPLAAGGGTVEMSHGTYPVPPPAVVELAERADWSLRGGPVETELLTPTGAAILAHVARGVETLPSIRVGTSGYGAGRKSFDRYPNVLRAVVGEATDDLRSDPITVLETNLDDATPEVLGGLHETLIEAGALDVIVVPATMKKSRPGHLVKVVTKPENARRVARKLAEETGTLGVREHGSGHRFVADREVRTVTLEVDDRSFEVDVKVATVDDEVFDVSGEYDDAAAVAAETDLSIRDVLRRAESSVYDRLRS